MKPPKELTDIFPDAKPRHVPHWAAVGCVAWECNREYVMAWNGEWWFFSGRSKRVPEVGAGKTAEDAVGNFRRKREYRNQPPTP